MKRLLLFNCVLLFSINIYSEEMDESLKVSPLDSDNYYVFLNATDCEIRSTPFEKFFAARIPNICDMDKTSHIVDVPAYIIANVINELENNLEIFRNRLCHVQNKTNCRIVVNFNGTLGKIKTLQNAAVKPPTTSGSELGESNTNLYIYIGAGVAGVVLIVAAQSACIVSYYSRKVATTQRALENILHIREETRDENERYSHEPVTKTKNSVPQEDNVYESLEHFDVTAAKGDGGTIKSMDIKNRPPLPLPTEMPLGREGWSTVKANGSPRPPMPLPQEFPNSAYDARTLPLKNKTQKDFHENLPEPQPLGSLKSKLKHNAMQSGPGVPMLPRNISQPGPAQPGSRERLPDPPINAGLPPPRLGSNALLKNTTPSLVRKPPPNPLLQRKASHLGSRERLHSPAVRDNTPATPLRVPHIIPKHHAPGNIVNELTRVFAKINPPVEPPEDRHNSSDEEWTYEKLPPTNKYLK